jgi:hypothetical protein
MVPESNPYQMISSSRSKCERPLQGITNKSPLEHGAIMVGQCVDIFDEVAVFFGIQQHFSGGAVVLGFVALPAHGELGGAEVGFDGEVQVALESARR